MACSQLYVLYKKALNAVKTYLFINIDFKELTLNLKIRRTFVNTVESILRLIKILQRAYAHYKIRLNKFIIYLINKSFGVREEYRIIL